MDLSYKHRSECHNIYDIGQMRLSLLMEITEKQLCTQGASMDGIILADFADFQPASQTNYSMKTCLGFVHAHVSP